MSGLTLCIHMHLSPLNNWQNLCPSFADGHTEAEGMKCLSKATASRGGRVWAQGFNVWFPNLPSVVSAHSLRGPSLSFSFILLSSLVHEARSHSSFNTWGDHLLQEGFLALQRGIHTIPPWLSATGVFTDTHWLALWLFLLVYLGDCELL